MDEIFAIVLLVVVLSFGGCTVYLFWEEMHCESRLHKFRGRGTGQTLEDPISWGDKVPYDKNGPIPPPIEWPKKETE